MQRCISTICAKSGPKFLPGRAVEISSSARYGLPPGRRAEVTVSAPSLSWAWARSVLHDRASKLRPSGCASLEKRQAEKDRNPGGTCETPANGQRKTKQGGGDCGENTKRYSDKNSPPRRSPDKRPNNYSRITQQILPGALLVQLSRIGRQMRPNFGRRWSNSTKVDQSWPMSNQCQASRRTYWSDFAADA